MGQGRLWRQRQVSKHTEGGGRTCCQQSRLPAADETDAARTQLQSAPGLHLRRRRRGQRRLQGRRRRSDGLRASRPLAISRSGFLGHRLRPGRRTRRLHARFPLPRLYPSNRGLLKKKNRSD